MLRMGRSPRVEQPNEAERPAPPQQPQQQQTAAPVRPATPPPVTAATAQPQPQTPRPETATPSTPRAVSETEALARELREGVMSGFLGGNTVLTGDAEFKGMLRIDGRFSGRIVSEKGTLIVSAGGRVDADIRVGTARVNGTVNGDITATERIELGRSARVVGDIRTPALVIEQGAVFEGGCRMTQAPAAKAQQPVEKAAAPAARPVVAAKPRPAVQQQPAAAAPQTGSPSAGVENLATSAVS
jgi:cytoskeletal protein CcmA (bactofilin family)